MTPNENAGGPELPNPPPPHHREGLERQKGRPMWGCVRAIVVTFSVLILLLILTIGGGWFYLGTTSFADLVRLRIEKNLEAHLGRDVTIKRVTIVQSRPARVVLDDLRIANLPGARHPYFATVRQVEITGGIESFWTRTIRVGRLDIRDPQLFFEVYPDGARYDHNFPSWKPSKPARYQITRVDVKKMFVTGGRFEMNDIRHEIYADLTGLVSEITPTSAKQIYEGIATSALTRIRIQDYQEIQVDLRGGFYYKPGALELKSVALRGEGLEAFVSGKIDPLTDAVYDLHIATRAELARVQQIFEIEKALRGRVALDATLRGTKGTFLLDGNFKAPSIHADVYDIADLEGRARVSDKTARLDIATGSFVGGTLSGRYDLARYAEPYPMSVDLRFDRLSLEGLFADWGMKETGLRGAATGTLQYGWSKDDILGGSGKGKATLQPGAVAFGQARFPMPLRGDTAFALDRGTIRFSPSNVKTPQSDVAFRGTLRIEDLLSNLDVDIDSRDFSELDKVAYNIARSTGNDDFELLGLGGQGRLQGHVSGKLDAPGVTASIQASDTRFNNQLLGRSDIALRYAGETGILTFDHARFQDGDAQMAMTGTFAFPEKGPSPVFDLSIDAVNFPVERALAITTLDLLARGIGTGNLRVVGTPENGHVDFSPLTIARGGGELHLRGRIDWYPGEGNVRFDLDLGAQSYPVDEIIAFLDLGTLPVTGALTGTLHLEGRKDDLAGAGSIIVRGGSVFGEPVDVASADLAFTTGAVRASNIDVQAPAGRIAGEAEYTFATETFAYNIRGEQLDLSRFKALTGIAGLFGGRVTFTSTGAGSMTQPEIVLEGTIAEATLRGASFPPDAPPPTFYLAVRNGQLIVRASAFDIMNVEASGTVAPDGALDGFVRASISDLGQFLRIFANAPDLPAEGQLEVDLALGGNTKSIETLRIVGTVPVLDLTISDQRLVPVEPVRFTIADGRLRVDSLHLARNGSSFVIRGGMELAGDRRIDLAVEGSIAATLLALFVPGVRASGAVNVAAGVTGTMDAPRIEGTAEIVDGEFKVPGFPQLIDEVTGTIVFRGDLVEIDSLRANVGGGLVIAGGFLTMKGTAVDRVRLTLRGTDVSLRYFEGVTMAGDFDLLLSGDTARFVLQGDVAVDRAVYFNDFDFSRSLLDALLERQALVPAVAASWQDKVALRIHLVADDTLAIKNNIADLTASAELDVTGTLANPAVLGLVTIDEGGTARFQDIDYRITRGTINFQNPFRIDPYFDITAEARVQEYDLSVNLTGTLDRITPTITSDPPISDLTLLSLLGPSSIGQTQQTSMTAQSLQATGTSLLFESLGGLIGAKVLPFVDTVRLDLQNETSEPVVSFEKRINNQVRAVVTYNTRNNQNIEYVEWQLTPDWLLQLMRDSEQENNFLISAIDARFRRRYEGHWRLHRPRPNAPAGRVSMSLPKDIADQPQVDAPAMDVKGLPIAAVNFRIDAPYDVEQIRNFVSIQAGSPLRIRDMQDTITRLFATGDFRDVRIDAARGAGGIDVTLILSLAYRIGKITIEGAGDERGRVTRKIFVHEGDVVSLSAIDRSAVAIQTELTRRGYPEATVDPETTFVRESNRADVIFHAGRGPLAHIAAITIEGSTAPFTPEQLIERMSWKPGSVFRAEKEEAQAERVRSWLARKNYRKAVVTFLAADYDGETNTATLRYRVTVGPKVRVEIAGIARRLVRSSITLRKDEAYSEDLVERGADAMVTRLQERGYFLATVDLEEALVGDEWVVTYHVNPGSRYTFRDVEFEGNLTVPDRELQSVLTIAPPGGFRGLMRRFFRRPTGITQEQLSEQRDALQSYYILHGYQQAAVATPVAQPQPDETLTVLFNITEGPRTIVASVGLEGNETFTADRLPDLQIVQGEPIDPTLVSADRLALTSYYATRGYAKVQVSPQVIFSADKTKADVRYRIAEGPKVAIDEVIVRGNTYTDRDVVLKKSRLRKGEPFSYKAVLEAQQELYRLAIFRRVDVLEQTADATVATRDVVIQVQEGRNLTVAGSLGYSTDQGARGIATLSHRNLFGTGRYLGIDARVAQKDQLYSLNYREPFLGNFDIPTQLTFFRGTESRADARFRKTGTFVELSRIAGLKRRWSLRYDYRVTRCVSGAKCDAATGEIPIPEIPREDQQIKISSISPSFFWDLRDDPLNPTRGVFSNASLEYAFPLAQARTDFLKLFGHGAWHQRVTSRSSFVVSSSLGLIEPLVENGPGSIVPISERYVAGGEMTHRAFALDELGIEGETLVCIKEQMTVPCTESGVNIVSLGGNGMVLANLEYRFPIFGSLGGALFVDAGNVWRTTSAIDLGNLRYGAGAGIRYLTPVGPLRLDVGYKIDRQPWEDPYAFFITLGFPF